MPTIRFAGLAFWILAVAWPAGTLAQPETLDASRIDAHVEAVMASSRVPGVAVGIVHEDRVVYLKGYGDAGNGGPVTPQTLFALASASKPFTSLAVMQLVEAGKIDLDQPLRTYLPEFQLADADAAARITVRHLLSHVSGLSTFAGRQHFFSRDNSPDALAGYVRELAAVRPTAPAGSRFQYSNTNFTVLARLVEVVSGLPFEQYICERILTPLGMPRTCFSSDEAIGRAIGHRYWFGRPVAFSGVPSSRHHLGAAGMYSSAEELSRFLIAHLNGGQIEDQSVLSPEGIAALHKPAVEDRPKWHYALGWDNRDTPNGWYVGHNGGWPEFQADMIMSVNDRWGVATLINVSGPDTSGETMKLANDILDLCRNRPVTPPRKRDFVERHFQKMQLGFLVMQVVPALFFYRRVRRWRRVAEKRPRRWRLVWVWHGVVVLANLALAYFLLIGSPMAFEYTLREALLFGPAPTWILFLSAGFALTWCVIRTVLVVRSYRASGPPAVSAI
jgi:CubicO group peptidase (beta-lactamase class C family)